MVKKYYKDWNKFVDSSSQFLVENLNKTRVTFKYRNKQPSNGKLYVTNDNKSYYIKLTNKKDLDKLENYFKGVLYTMAGAEMKEEPKIEPQKEKEEPKKTKKNKGKKKGNK